MESTTRLPDSFIDEVKRRVDLVEVMGSAVKLKGQGRTLYGLCPFHDERTPSFAVTPSQGTYLCRGCGAKGDAISWLTKREGLSFYAAVAELAKRVGIQMPAPEMSAQLKRERQERFAVLAALQQAQALYVYGLGQSAEASAYLHNVRNLEPEIIEAFGVGFVGSGIRGVLARRVRATAIMTQAGITQATTSGHDVELLRHRITVPLRNEQGQTIGFAGRIPPFRTASGPKYLNTPETIVFRKSTELFGLDRARAAIARSRVAVLVEGYFDVIGLHQAGEHRAVAAMGTALSEAQARRLLRDVDVVYVCYDGDAAGRRATAAAAETLLAQMTDRQQLRIAIREDGKDPDDLVREGGLPAWEAHLSASHSLADYLVAVLCAGVDLDAPETVAPVAAAAQGWVARGVHCPLYARALRAALERRLGISLS